MKAFVFWLRLLKGFIKIFPFVLNYFVHGEPARVNTYGYDVTNNPNVQATVTKHLWFNQA